MPKILKIAQTPHRRGMVARQYTHDFIPENTVYHHAVVFTGCDYCLRRHENLYYFRDFIVVEFGWLGDGEGVFGVELKAVS
jgi:hypothetical protein